MVLTKNPYGKYDKPFCKRVLPFCIKYFKKNTNLEPLHTNQQVFYAFYGEVQVHVQCQGIGSNFGSPQFCLNFDNNSGTMPPLTILSCHDFN